MLAVEQRLVSKGSGLQLRVMQPGGKQTEDQHFSEIILTYVTVVAHPSRKAGTVISTNHIFAIVSIEARLSPTLVNVCKVETRDTKTGNKKPHHQAQLCYTHPTKNKVFTCLDISLKFTLLYSVVPWC